MKRTIERITRTAMLAVAFMLCATSAWAATKPLAVWNGDFVDGAERGGFTLNARNNTVAADGSKITITDQGDGGVLVSTTVSDYKSLICIAGFKTNECSLANSPFLMATQVNRNSGTDLTGIFLDSTGKFQGSWVRGNGQGSQNVVYPAGEGIHYFADVFGQSVSYGTKAYLDGTTLVVSDASLASSSGNTTGMSIGGAYDSSKLTGAEINYIAVFASTSNEHPSDYADYLKAFSPTAMTSAANPADGDTLSASDNATLASQGINLPADGRITVNGSVMTSAVFVQANATLGFSGSSTLTIGDGTGPLYIDSAATLTIDLNGVTAPTAESPFVLLVKGQVYGAAQVDFTNVPANTMTSIGEGGTIALLHNSVYTDLLASWKSNGQKVFAWRDATGNAFQSCNVSLVDTDTGAIEATTATTHSYSKNGGFNDENPAGVLYYDDPANASSTYVNYSYFTLGGLFVTAGGSSLGNSGQQLKLGDNKSNSGKTFHYVFAQSFDLGPFKNDSKLYGPVDLTIYEGATVTLSANGLKLANDGGMVANLKMSGGGVLKTSGTITAESGSNGITLDYSALDVSRTEPFIQGNLSIHDNVKLVLPAALAANTPYQLCSGTLTVGSTSLQKSITVGSNTFLADLTFDTSAKTVSYCPARTTTVSGGTAEWSSLTWANGTGTAGWASGANAHITVSAASTISVGSATTVNKLKLLGSADLTITGIDNLTVGSFDLSDYTGNLNIAVDNAATVGTLKFIGSTDVIITGISNLTLESFDLSGYTGNLIVDGGLPAAVTLCGGNLVFDIAGSTDISSSRNTADAFQTYAISGTGNVYKRGVGSFYFGRPSAETIIENSYTGSTYIENGIARRYGGKAFGSNSNKVYVGSDATSSASVDLVSAWDGANSYEFHIAGRGFAQYPAMMQRDSNSSGGHSVGSLYLDANATIGGDKDIRFGNYGGSWRMYLQGHTLTKVGDGTLTIDDFATASAGTVEVAAGTLKPSCFDNSASNSKLIINEGAKCQTAFWYQGENRFCWNDVINDGTISVDGNDAGGKQNLLYVYTSYAGKGNINRLYLKNGVTVKPTSATTGMTVSGALTLEGKINVDLSGIDLTGRYDLPIIAGPTQIDKDNDVDTFNRGYNSANWGLYSELVSEGTYVLGVRLSTITDPVSWNGAGGTWSVNSFDGGTENYSNQALQTVTFADDGESTDPIAVAVSGAKTVNALNFTADHRDITLSGDAITAATVSKSGDGVAIVNNVLSVTTSISVTDGVLVLNPNGEDVSDVNSLDDGTLVIYVGTGVTRTVTESITATKIVKRGAGTLNVTATDPFNVPMTIDAGVVVITSAPTVAFLVNENGILELTNTGSYKDDREVTNFSNVTGTGTIRYNGSGWRSLPRSNLFADTLSVELEQPSGVVVAANNLTIGSISGSKDLRSDLDSSGKTFTVKQAKDGVWSGSFHGGEDRLAKFVVQGGASSTGTLTLAGESTADGTNNYNDELEVASSGSVNLTGSWIGDTTVYGEFGGTGSLTGALTFNAGSTFKVWATGGLSVTGGITFPETSLTVDVSDLTIGREDSTVLLTATSGSNFPAVGNFTLTGSSTHVLSKTGQKELSLLPIIATYSRNDGSGIVTPYADSVDVAISALVTQKATYPNAYVTVFIGAPSYYTAELLASNGIALDAETGNYVIAEAKIDDTLYPTIEAAIANAGENDTVVLARNISKTEIAVNKEVEFSEGDYTFTGSFTGNGTLALPDGTLLKSPSPDRWASGWTGTVWIRNYTSLTGKSIQSGSPHGETSFEPNDYGNINSTVKFTGVKGYFRANNVENYTIQPALELEDDGETPGLLLYNGWGYNSNVQCYTSIRELKGSGTLEADNTTPASSVLLQVQNWDDFTGTLTLPLKTVAFGSTLPVQTEVDGGGCIAVQSGASVEVPAGKTWTVGSGVVVYGNLSLGTGAAIVNTTDANTWIKCGAGKVTLNALGDLPATPASTWAGTVVIPAHTTNTALELNNYGVEGSTVEIPGMSDGWLQAPNYGTVAINPNLRLTGTMLLDDMSSREYSFQTISGNGSLQVTDSDCTSVSIAKIAADFEGSITNTSGKPMTIATVDLAAAPSIPSKVLTTSGTKITVTSVTVDGTPTYPSGATVVLSKDDGVYVIRTGTIFSVY